MGLWCWGLVGYKSEFVCSFVLFNSFRGGGSRGSEYLVVGKSVGEGGKSKAANHLTKSFSFFFLPIYVG